MANERSFSFKLLGIAGLCAASLLVASPRLGAQQRGPAWTSEQQPLVKRLDGLRALPDAVRAQQTLQLALAIRSLPASPEKVELANGLANLSTEGDFGRDTLQAVTTTLADALRERPMPDVQGQPNMAYAELATLARYEHMHAALDAPQFTAALAALQASDARRQAAQFVLPDLAGKTWKRSELRGKVVLVNFWATWCPPCRKEMPDLEALYQRFGSRGLVVLGVSDDDAAKVRVFAQQHGVSYPVLLDAGSKVNHLYDIEGIPMSFLYDRQGKLVAVAPDMRTQAQFLAMLAKAGLN